MDRKATASIKNTAVTSAIFAEVHSGSPSLGSRVSISTASRRSISGTIKFTGSGVIPSGFHYVGPHALTKGKLIWRLLRPLLGFNVIHSFRDG